MAILYTQEQLINYANDCSMQDLGLNEVKHNINYQSINKYTKYTSKLEYNVK